MDPSTCDTPENDLLLEDAEDVALAVPEAFRVVDEDTANWVLTKFVEAKARSERAAAWADRIKRRSQREAEHLLFRFEQQLREWTQAELGRSRSRRKSITLPSGVLGFRTQKSSLVVDDEIAVRGYSESTAKNTARGRMAAILDGRSTHCGHQCNQGESGRYYAMTRNIETPTHGTRERRALFPAKHLEDAVLSAVREVLADIAPHLEAVRA